MSEKCSDIFVALSCFAISLGLYIHTLAPGLLYGDSGELQTIAYTLGMGHPTGYPVYVTVAKVFSQLRIGEIAYRINLFSAFSGAMAVAFVYLIARKLECNRPSAVFAALMLTLTPLFWKYASITEVYAFSAAWLSVLIFSVLKWKESNGFFWGMVTGLMGGLSLGVHTTISIALPAFFLYFAIPSRLADEKLWIRLRSFIVGTLLGIGAFLLLFLFLDHRNAPAGYYNSTVIPSLSAWGMKSTDFDSPLERLSFLYFPPQFRGKFLAASMSEIVLRLENFVSDYSILLLFSLLGLLSFFFSRKPSSEIREGLLFAALLMIWLTFAFSYDVVDYYVFFIPSLLMLVILAGRGMQFVLSSLSRFTSPNWALTVFVVLVGYGVGLGRYTAALPDALIHNVPPGLDAKQKFAFQFPANYKIKAEKVVDVVEDDAIIFTDWNRLYSLYYVAHVLEGRTEMDFHQYYPQLDPNADISSLLSYIDSQINSRPIYFTRYPAVLQNYYEIFPVRSGLFEITKK